jgi:hypothetical protein
MNSEFKFFYKEILSSINTPQGHQMLNIEGNEPIVKISPNSYHKLKGFTNGYPILEATFFTSDRILEKFLPLFSPSKLYRYAWLSTAFTSNTGEGEIDTGNKGTWAEARGATTGATAGTIRTYASTGFDVIRTFFPINTSSLTANATITAGVNTFKLYRDDTVIGLFNADTTSFELVQTAQASPTALAGGDFDSVTFTSGGSVALSATSNNTYFTVTLNATADGWINTTGHTLLGGILGRDLNNSQPTGINGIGAQNRGAANPPTLTVTYILKGGLLHNSEI